MSDNDSEYDEEVISQLAAVRESGATNMMSRQGVRRVASEMGFAELVEFIREEDSATYMDYLKEMGSRR